MLSKVMVSSIENTGIFHVHSIETVEKLLFAYSINGMRLLIYIFDR